MGILDLNAPCPASTINFPVLYLASQLQSPHFHEARGA